MIYEFSDLTLDLDRHLLTRGGKPVKLTKLSFKALQDLVKAAPSLISHDELIDQIWGPRRVITLDNLSQRMKTMRQSLGDDPNKPIYIEGVRGEGYRLVPEVTVRPPTTSGPKPVHSWRPGMLAILIVILAVLLGWLAMERTNFTDDEPAVSSLDSTPPAPDISDRPREPAVAVLPFANLSADPTNQFFADGIHDDLLTRISKIQDIKTISRTSVMTYRGSDKKVGAIAQELGVSTILEGGVQRAGDQVRINLQLIDAETDAHLWAQTYTRQLTATNVFIVQAEITEAVAGALQAILSEDERQQFEKQPTANLQALDAYFRGNQFFDQHTSESLAQAIVAYRSAVDLDPEFALAYSNLALAILQQVWLNGYPIQAQLEESRPFIDQAILLDPQSTSAFTALGRWFQTAGDLDKSEKAFKQALVLGPNNSSALAHYGNLKQRMSDPASALRLFEKAMELDPQNNGLKHQLAEIMGTVGLAKEAIPMMEGILANQPDHAGTYRVLADLYSLGLYRHDKAMKALRMAYELDPGHPWNSFNIGNMNYRMGDFENASLWLNHAASLVPASEQAPILRGWAYINARDLESARKEFDRSTEENIVYWIGVFTLARVDTADGRPEDAIERYMDYEPDFDGRKSLLNFSYGVGAIHAYQKLGELEKAQALIDEMMLVVEANPPLSYHAVHILDASLYALAGQSESAIELLANWVDQGGSTSFLQIQTGFELSVLADDPRYQELLQTVENRLNEQRANLARWEANGEMPPIPSVVRGPE